MMTHNLMRAAFLEARRSPKNQTTLLYCKRIGTTFRILDAFKSLKTDILVMSAKWDLRLIRRADDTLSSPAMSAKFSSKATGISKN